LFNFQLSTKVKISANSKAIPDYNLSYMFSLSLYLKNKKMISTASVTIYAESTPNPASMKFVASRMLITGNPVEFLNKSQAKNSPLALELFNFPFVKAIFMSSNFITITKTEIIDWNEIILEIREFLKDYLSTGKPVFSEAVITAKSQIVDEFQEPQLSSEIDIKIAGILDEYIKPAVEGDGGAISFKSFQNGIVTVVLQGACSGCPSSTMTLKAGIEGLLKRMVPEVQQVVAEMQ